MSHGSVAKAARLSKEKWPMHYCPVRNCLWRTYDARTDTFTACGKHGALHIDAVKKEQELLSAYAERMGQA